MKLKAEVAAYSSVVGGGINLLDDKGRIFCQLPIVSLAQGWDDQQVRDNYKRHVTTVSNKIAEKLDGIEIPLPWDTKEEKKDEGNADG